MSISDSGKITLSLKTSSSWINVRRVKLDMSSGREHVWVTLVAYAVAMFGGCEKVLKHYFFDKGVFN